MSEAGGQANDPLARLVSRSREGDRAALEALLEAIRDDVYGLALRMLWHPEDAEDATQEILVKVMTGLDGFRGEATFRTWVYRVAANTLMTTRKRRVEREEITFEEFADQLAIGLSDEPPPVDSARRTLAEEVKIGCAHGMLQCLDRGHRLAYLLGEVLELQHREAAAVLDITPAAYRKRLSRARRRLHGFLRRHCGLVSDSAPCRCHRRIDAAVEAGRVDPEHLLFADPERVARGKRAVENLRDSAAVLRASLEPRTPERLAESIRRLLDSAHYRILTGNEDDSLCRGA